MSILDEYYKLDENSKENFENILLTMREEYRKDVKEFIKDLREGKLKNKNNIELDMIYPGLKIEFEKLIGKFKKEKQVKNISAEDIIKLSREEKENLLKYLKIEPKAKYISRLIEAIIQGKVSEEQIDFDGFSEEEIVYLNEAYYCIKNYNGNEKFKMQNKRGRL